MKTKIFKAQVKTPGDQGRFECAFATLDVVDNDGDLTIPGAFGSQSVIVEGWNHEQKLPVGRGQIFERGNEAICEGTFFLDTTAGREHYATIKALDSLTEWSYTFSIIASRPGRNGAAKRILEKLDVWGVSPVTRGAGVGTRTLAIKAGKRSLYGMTDEDIRLELELLRIEADLMEERQKGRAEIKNVLTGIERIRDELLDSRIADLERRLKASDARPMTNRDRIRAAIIARYNDPTEEDEGATWYDARWIDAMVDGYLANLVARDVRWQESRGGMSPNYAIAEERVRRWANQVV
jgi:hypothetical protein